MIRFEFIPPEDWLGAASLSEAIQQQFDNTISGVDLGDRPTGDSGLRCDPVTLVALVTAVGSVIGPFVAGLLAIARQRSANHVRLRSRGGAEIEFPVNLPEREIDRLVLKLRELDGETVDVVLKGQA